MNTPRLIEVDFPLRKVSEESAREKNIRQGHLSTLHTWWARKPLAASRATTLAALLPDDPKKRKELLDLVAQISPWEVVSKNHRSGIQLLEKARRLIREAFGGRAPRVLDCFAGGGAIPLEALRLGCETYALDYNPVAVLLNKAVVEFPERFGRPGSVSRIPLPPGQKGDGGRLFADKSQAAKTASPLVVAVKAWGDWVLEEARKELAPFYPVDSDGGVPVGYYWMRTIPCQNPECRVDIPLTANLWLAKKGTRKIALRLIPNAATRSIDVAIEGQGGKRLSFDPDEGTVSRARVRCPLCSGTVDDKTTRRLFREGKAGQRMMAVVVHYPGKTGKAYRLPTDKDLMAYQAAEKALGKKRKQLADQWGIDPVPDEEMSGTMRPPNYGIIRWGELFNSRQKLALITFADKVRQAHSLMLQQDTDPEFAKAVVTFIALTLDKIVESCNTLARWDSSREALADAFSRPRIPMIWDYVELNAFGGGPGSWDSAFEHTLQVLSHLTPLTISTRHDIGAVLREHKRELRDKFGVREIGIFGSYVRNEQGCTSDVDILVDFDQVPSFSQFAELQDYLSDLLGVRVDLVRKTAIRPELRDRILSEVIML